jgi:hypothetical protein
VIDDRVEAVFAGSVVFGGLDRLTTKVIAAWQSSWTRNHVTRIPSVPGRSDALNTIVFWAIAGLTAAVVALVLAPMATTPRPLGWIVPLVVGVACAAVAVIAGARRSPGALPR